MGSQFELNFLCKIFKIQKNKPKFLTGRFLSRRPQLHQDVDVYDGSRTHTSCQLGANPGMAPSCPVMGQGVRRLAS